MATDTVTLPEPPATISDFERNAFLSQIPSETTLAERIFLFRYFQELWEGGGKVVEIGPFLGGTTRAIAWGMSRNPRLATDAMLHTFDRFDAYYSAAQLRQTIQPLVHGGTFTAARADDLCRVADFERLFAAIHQPHDYSRLVQLHNSPMPDFPEDVDGSNALDVFKNDGDLGGVFVDGCKSWAATHYAMKFLLPRLRPAAPVIFQDYGWYTCFWISAFVYALRDVLEWRAFADATYSFRLTRMVTAEEIARRFARSANEMGEAFFKKAAAHLYEQSRQCQDRRGMLIAQLHHVAALVTLNRKPEAARLLKKINPREFPEFANMIQGCIKSPTYRAGNKPIYWNEGSADEPATAPSKVVAPPVTSPPLVVSAPLTPAPLTPVAARPAPAEASIERVIAEKTHYWQQKGPALKHFNASGVRPKPQFAPILERMLAIIPPNSRIIDVGCGHGRLAIPLAEAGHSVVATDVSEEMLALLRQHQRDLPIDVRLGDAHRLSAGDGEFDVVFSSDFMPHFPDWPRLLQEKARVCRKGGLVLFLFNFTDHKTFAAPLGGDAFEHPYSSLPGSPKPFWAECSLEQMITVAETAGLKFREALPMKFLHDSFAFGGALGTAKYREFQGELAKRLSASPAVAEFFGWLDFNVFQQLPFFAAYSSLLVLERVGDSLVPSPVSVSAE
jgi:SAM-dependent methyltransferase